MLTDMVIGAMVGGCVTLLLVVLISEWNENKED